jgi:hypothetical protein
MLHSQMFAHDKEDLLFHIATEMRSQNLSKEFIVSAVQTALEFEGVADLMIMWGDETDPKERAEIVADIQDLIVDCNHKEQK